MNKITLKFATLSIIIIVYFLASQGYQPKVEDFQLIKKEVFYPKWSHTNNRIVYNVLLYPIIINIQC